MRTIYSLLICALLAPWIASCSEDEQSGLIQSTLPQPTGSVTEATVSSLTFTWESIADATQYAYELKDTDGEVITGGTTTDHSVRLTGLTDNTTYTLEVWAYAAIGSDKGRSSVTTLTATTPPIVPLATPQPVFRNEGSVVVIEWPAVEHADEYIWECRDADGNICKELSATTQTSIRITGLEAGEYLLHIRAVSRQDAYSLSEQADLHFTVEKRELYRAEATVNYNGNKRTVELIAYEGGAYTALKWYGYEGYDINFLVEADGSVSLPGYESDATYTHIPIMDGYKAYLYNGYTSFEQEGTTCTLWFYEAYGSDYSYITWEKPSSLTADALVGSYTEKSSGYDTYLYDWGTSDYSFSYDDNVVTIEKVDEQTILLKNFYYVGESLTGVINAATRTITFSAGQAFCTYYNFASEHDAGTAVEAQIDDQMNITINGWGAWYGGICYVTDTQTTLTRK